MMIFMVMVVVGICYRLVIIMLLNLKRIVSVISVNSAFHLPSALVVHQPLYCLFSYLRQLQGGIPDDGTHDVP